jgi:hypothetical protein
VLLSALGAGCGDDDARTGDAGRTDGGLGVDAGAERDAGTADGSTGEADAGGAADAGMALSLGRDRTIDSLDGSERMEFCAYFIEALGGPGPRDCFDGARVQTVEACTDSLPSCASTVGEIADCVDAIGGDFCLIPSEPACEPFLMCTTSEEP